MTALVLFLLSLLVVPQVQQYWYDAQPNDDFLIVRSVAPTSGGLDEIVVVYDRAVKQPFIATYTVKVYSVNRDGNQIAVCVGSNTISYTPRDGQVVMKLEQFIGDECKLQSGTYFLEIIWVIIREGYHDKIVRHTSLPFEVRDVGYKS